MIMISRDRSYFPVQAGETYYHNEVTDATSWERPASMAAKAPEAAPEPAAAAPPEPAPAAASTASTANTADAKPARRGLPQGISGPTEIQHRSLKKVSNRAFERKKDQDLQWAARGEAACDVQGRGNQPV